jgi:FAD:protein FMN transferase
MGVPVRIRLHAADVPAAENAARAAFARIATLDRMMSDYRADSELKRLEGNGSAWTIVSPELFAVLERALEVAAASGGAFDPTVGPIVSLWRDARVTRRLPDAAALSSARARVGWAQVQLDASRRAVRFARPGMGLDLGGVAKGYIAQQALDTLRAHGVHSALIEAGGDIAVSAAPPGRAGWTIDVGDASEALRERAHALTYAALATSGPGAQFVEIDGVRYSHVVDPRTGAALTNQVTAHVIATDAATADALATALSIVGSADRPRLLSRYPGVLASVK